MNRAQRERERKRKQAARAIDRSQASTPKSAANNHSATNSQPSTSMNTANTHTATSVIQILYPLFMASCGIPNCLKIEAFGKFPMVTRIKWALAIISEISSTTR